MAIYYTAPYWPEPVIVFSAIETDGFVTVEAAGLQTSRHYTITLPVTEWAELKPSQEWHPTFRANAAQLKLAVEAERLRLAFTCDPLLATNNAVVDLVPHQMEAVYDYMLPQPTIRHLMAHDQRTSLQSPAGLSDAERREAHRGPLGSRLPRGLQRLPRAPQRSAGRLLLTPE